ncbi:hypothetical protein D3C84_790610 [compost metagenome]
MLVHRRHTVYGLGQVRAVPHAFVGNQRRGLGQLQRRDLHVALADAEDHGFPRKPWLTSRGALPGLGRHQAGGLFEHVQRDLFPEAEHGHVVVQAIDPQLVRQVVEVGVVGAHDRRVHVHPAVAAVVPVTVFVIEVRELVITRVEDAGLRGHDTRIQAGNRHFRLDGRTRRIKTAQHAVEQRPVDGVMQCRVLLEADPGHEQVRVKAWLADHGQHFTGRRIERYH